MLHAVHEANAAGEVYWNASQPAAHAKQTRVRLPCGRDRLLVNRQVESNAYLVVSVDDQDRIVRVYRTAEPYPSLDVAESVLKRLVRHIESAQYKGFSMLLDTRDAAGRNDPEFEELMVRYAPQLFAPFPRRAVLLRSVAGVMHASRVSLRHDSAAPDVFRDEREAMLYLQGKRPSTRPPPRG